MRRLLPIALISLLAACSNTPDVVSRLRPYKIDVRQGNMVTQEMAAQLKPGQTKDQVRFILGTPLVADMFHADRWDYVYRMQRGNGSVEERRLAVFFENDQLKRVEGDIVAPGVAPAPPPAPKQAPPRAAEEKGFFDRILGWFGL